MWPMSYSFHYNNKALSEQLLGDMEMVGHHLCHKCFSYDSYNIVACSDYRKQNYTFTPLLTVQLCILPDSGRDLEGPHVCHHEPDTRFRFGNEGSPDKLSFYHGKTRRYP